MKRREATAAYVASKRMSRVSLPSNGICPASRLPYFVCNCDNHRCGLCGRRESQRDERRSVPGLLYNCPCERNRRQNGFPPHWRTGLITSSG